MDVIWTGIKYGLFLTILVGPLVFALVQAGVERGFRAGAAIGLGIWSSDSLFIMMAYYGYATIKSVVQWPHFELTVGIAGGIILIGTGIYTLMTETPDINKQKKLSGTYFTLWLKGFLINSLNPFTVFFWIFVMTTVVAEQEFTPQESGLYFSGIIGTVILTDCLKILLAKRLRRYLDVHHLVWVRRITGVALIIFGVLLMGRVLL